MGVIGFFVGAAYAAGAAAFGWYTWRRGSLSAGGAVTAMLLGLLVTLTAGVTWLLPLFVFFLSSSLLGKLLPVTTVAGDAKDKQPRDVVQVLCNGGVYGLVALLDLDPTLLLVTLAVATADTWASEIGKYFRRPTFDVLRLRRVPPGLSGGVSTVGNAGGAAGALLLGSLGFLLIDGYSVTDYLAVSTLGFLGMLLDSVLGAGLQARYRDPATGVLSDVLPPGGRLVSGYWWVSNDLVNLAAIGLTTALGYLIA